MQKKFILGTNAIRTFGKIGESLGRNGFLPVKTPMTKHHPRLQFEYKITDK